MLKGNTMKLKSVIFTFAATSTITASMQAGGTLSIVSPMSAEDKNLFTAAGKGDIKRAQRALDNGARINQKCWGLDRATPVIFAASSEQVDMVSFLLGQRADIDIRDSEGFSAFAWALTKNNVPLLKLLFEKITPRQVASAFEQRVYGEKLSEGFENRSIEMQQAILEYLDMHTTEESS